MSENLQNPYQTPQTKVENSSSLQNNIRNDNSWYSTSGRIGRLRFVAYQVFVSFILLAVMGIAFATGIAFSQLDDVAASVTILFAIVLIIPMFVYTNIIYPIRRLHDLGHSGWFCLILILVPVLNLVMYLYLMFAPGKKEPNEYGYPPKDNQTIHWIAALTIPIVVVLGILAAIVLPAYQEYLQGATMNTVVIATPIV